MIFDSTRVIVTRHGIDVKESEDVKLHLLKAPDGAIMSIQLSVRLFSGDQATRSDPRPHNGPASQTENPTPDLLDYMLEFQNSC